MSWARATQIKRHRLPEESGSLAAFIIPDSAAHAFGPYIPQALHHASRQAQLRHDMSAAVFAAGGGYNPSSAVDWASLPLASYRMREIDSGKGRSRQSPLALPITRRLSWWVALRSFFTFSSEKSRLFSLSRWASTACSNLAVVANLP